MHPMISLGALRSLAFWHELRSVKIVHTVASLCACSPHAGWWKHSEQRSLVFRSNLVPENMPAGRVAPICRAVSATLFLTLAHLRRHFKFPGVDVHGEPYISPYECSYPVRRSCRVWSDENSPLFAAMTPDLSTTEINSLYIWWNEGELCHPTRVTCVVPNWTVMRANMLQERLPEFSLATFTMLEKLRHAVNDSLFYLLNAASSLLAIDLKYSCSTDKGRHFFPESWCQVVRNITSRRGAVTRQDLERLRDILVELELVEPCSLDTNPAGFTRKAPVEDRPQLPPYLWPTNSA